jgi:hypothetical protein
MSIKSVIKKNKKSIIIVTSIIIITIIIIVVVLLTKDTGDNVDDTVVVGEWSGSVTFLPKTSDHDPMDKKYGCNIENLKITTQSMIGVENDEDNDLYYKCNFDINVHNLQTSFYIDNNTTNNIANNINISASVILEKSFNTGSIVLLKPGQRFYLRMDPDLDYNDHRINKIDMTMERQEGLNVENINVYSLLMVSQTIGII